MRLTLRTLLAWLDDTLSPTEVREIGNQVAESPFAQELKERIQRVSRQRRLAVPSSTGPKATDPNLVAAYLDNELTPEGVADFEKLCLTSDVNLAEVASVHQILSLIGQKAKVPPEARHRMYHLIKGRESVSVKSLRSSKRTGRASPADPLQPWVTAPLPNRSGWERFLLPAGVLALIMLLGWSAWMSLTSSGPRTDRPGPVAVASPDAPAKTAPDSAPAADAGAPGLEDAPKTTPNNETLGAETAPEALAKADTKPASPTPAGAENQARPGDTPPAGALGKVEKADGVLLRWNAERREWERLNEQAPLKDQDRLLSLSPYRSSLAIGAAKVDLVGEAEVTVFSTSPGQAARFRLEGGRAVLHGASPDLPYAVEFADQTVFVTPRAGGSVGLERADRREQGSPLPSPSLLRFYATEGEVALSVDDSKESLSGPGAIAFEPPGRWIDKTDKPPPAWVEDAGPSPFETQIGEEFLKFFRADRPVVANLVEALDDSQKDVRRLAIAALGAMGDLAMVVPVLSKPQDPASRRAAADVLRKHLAQGPDQARRVQEQLQSDLGEGIASTSYKLLVGYTAQEAKENSTYAALVKSLSSDDLAIRELALDNLQSLTGRDSLDYDPDAPEGKGLKAWKDLQRDRELLPPARRGGR